MNPEKTYINISIYIYVCSKSINLQISLLLPFKVRSRRTHTRIPAISFCTGSFLSNKKKKEEEDIRYKNSYQSTATQRILSCLSIDKY